MNKSERELETVVKFASDGNLAIHVTDLKKAEDFYSNVLRFRLSQKTNKRLVYETGRITLYVVKDNKVLPFIPTLEVAHYEKAKQYLIKNGCKIIKEWPEDRALYFEDLSVS